MPGDGIALASSVRSTAQTMTLPGAGDARSRDRRARQRGERSSRRRELPPGGRIAQAAGRRPRCGPIRPETYDQPRRRRRTDAAALPGPWSGRGATIVHEPSSGAMRISLAVAPLTMGVEDELAVRRDRVGPAMRTAVRTEARSTAVHPAPLTGAREQARRTGCNPPHRSWSARRASEIGGFSVRRSVTSRRSALR